MNTTYAKEVVKKVQLRLDEAVKKMPTDPTKGTAGLAKALANWSDEQDATQEPAQDLDSGITSLFSDLDDMMESIMAQDERDYKFNLKEMKSDSKELGRDYKILEKALLRAKSQKEAFDKELAKL